MTDLSTPKRFKRHSVIDLTQSPQVAETSEEERVRLYRLVELHQDTIQKSKRIIQDSLERISEIETQLLHQSSDVNTTYTSNTPYTSKTTNAPSSQDSWDEWSEGETINFYKPKRTKADK